LTEQLFLKQFLKAVGTAEGYMQRWEQLYQAAVLETDWSKVDKDIQAAELAIKGRLREFSLDHGGTLEENQAIANAVKALGTLRDDVAEWRSRREF
jgi:hypothetical protein